MKKAEQEKLVADQQQIIDARKRKIREQNSRAAERWDVVSCRLPKGTRDRILAHGLTTNGLINTLVLAELDRLDAENKKI